MKRLLLQSLAIASIFSVTILLLLAVAETTGLMWLGKYLFVFAVVAYGLTENFVPTYGGASQLPVVFEWLLLLPAMVAFYWPIAALVLLLKTRRRSIAAARA